MKMRLRDYPVAVRRVRQQLEKYPSRKHSITLTELSAAEGIPLIILYMAYDKLGLMDQQSKADLDGLMQFYEVTELEYD